jgi:hypothetical protein
MGRQMNYRLCGAALVLAAAGLVPAPASLAQEQPGDEGWTSLFNGRDLSGWETWLGRAPGQREALGLDNDPLHVFTVVDGAIRISGQVFGALTTVEEFENYHLRVEHRWGEQKWPPRLERPRDNGICYHGTGEHGAHQGFWMRSHQLQIQEGDTGDYWSQAGAIVDVEGVTEGNEVHYVPGEDFVTVARGRIVKRGDHERPHGEWNVIEVIAEGDRATHIVNGEVVLVLHRSRHLVDGREQPLTRGRIQLQSEGAEAWFRNIEIRPLEVE